MNKLLLLILPVCFFFFLSCKKDSFNSSPDAQINFSSDSLYFDTVFTTVGSITQSFKIINQNNQKLLLSSIRLMGGQQSVFKINIDGAAGPLAQNIELEPNDSLYVFVSVHVNQTAASLPFIIQDSIQVLCNGVLHYVQLSAWGQNANFLQNKTITGNVTWTGKLPYVILGSLRVDSNATLSIESGCKIYFHADAPLLVDGTLLVNGQHFDSTRVYFLSDRLDLPYSGYPGSWPGIYLRGSSKDNQIQYAVIRNAYQGIVAEDPSSDANPKVILDQCIIDNMYDAGIMGAQSSILAQNCLISNCGKNIVIGFGGNYQFTHCTAASYSNDYVQHKDPVLNISNYVVQGTGTLSADLNAAFTNCIFWGANGIVDDEVVVSRQGAGLFNVSFSHCLWKAKNNPSGIDSSFILINQDPLFDSVNNQTLYYDFHLKSSSPALNYGAPSSILIDLDGNPRSVGLPDLGCYEYQ